MHLKARYKKSQKAFLVKLLWYGAFNVFDSQRTRRLLLVLLNFSFWLMLVFSGYLWEAWSTQGKRSKSKEGADYLNSLSILKRLCLKKNPLGCQNKSVLIKLCPILLQSVGQGPGKNS